MQVFDITLLSKLILFLELFNHSYLMAIINFNQTLYENSFKSSKVSLPVRTLRIMLCMLLLESRTITCIQSLHLNLSGKRCPACHFYVQLATRSRINTLGVLLLLVLLAEAGQLVNHLPFELLHRLVLILNFGLLVYLGLYFYTIVELKRLGQGLLTLMSYSLLVSKHYSSNPISSSYSLC